MDRTVLIPIAVIVKRSDSDSPWITEQWRPIGVVLNPPAGLTWHQLAQGDGWEHYLCASPDLELHAKETAGYLFNISGRDRTIYVVLRENEDRKQGDLPTQVHLVTVSPYEAQDYLDSGEEIVEPLDIPAGIDELVHAFVDRHHVEEEFKKRKLKRVKTEEHKFGQEPLHVLRGRMKDRGENDG